MPKLATLPATKPAVRQNPAIVPATSRSSSRMRGLRSVAELTIIEREEIQLREDRSVSATLRESLLASLPICQAEYCDERPKDEHLGPDIPGPVRVNDVDAKRER